MRLRLAGLGTLALCVLATFVLAAAPPVRADSPGGWNARAAAGYLDTRLDWWLKWPNAARDHDTACVSCHTALPYALARPALRSALGEREAAAPEQTLVSYVVKRVQLWKEV